MFVPPFGTSDAIIKYDIICSCFFWDCFEKEEIIRGLKDCFVFSQEWDMDVSVDFKPSQAGGFFHNLSRKVLIHFL